MEREGEGAEREGEVKEKGQSRGGGLDERVREGVWRGRVGR